VENSRSSGALDNPTADARHEKNAVAQTRPLRRPDGTIRDSFGNDSFPPMDRKHHAKQEGGFPPFFLEKLTANLTAKRADGSGSGGMKRICDCRFP
jgi:hypothetical protein